MPRRERQSKRRADALARLTLSQLFELEVGPARGGLRSAFADDDERRRAWAAHREHLHEEGHRLAWAEGRYGPADA